MFKPHNELARSGACTLGMAVLGMGFLWGSEALSHPLRPSGHVTITAIGAPESPEPDPAGGPSTELRAILDRLAKAKASPPVAPAPGGELAAAVALVRELTARAVGAAVLCAPAEAHDTMAAHEPPRRRQDELLAAVQAYTAELQGIVRRGIA
jgi:hypothetical protein